MVINELTDEEMKSILEPFMQLQSKVQRENRLKEVLQYEYVNFADLREQKKVKFLYKGFALTFDITNNGDVVYIMGESPRRWWLPLSLQAKPVF